MQKITSFFKVSSPRTVPNDQWTINGTATYSSQDIISPSGENLSEPEISALSSPEVDENENLENESQNEIRQPVLRTRKFRNKWKTEFPWIKMVDSNLVICTICEASGDKKDDWAHGKVLPDNCFKSTFQKHASSRKHKRNMNIVPAQNSLLACTIKALSNSEMKVTGLMKNILAALQHEMAINKVEFLHLLVDSHHESTKDMLKLDPSIKVKLSSKHRSLYSTYKMLNSLNATVSRAEIEKFQNSKAICLHIDESTDIKAAKLLLVYLTISTNNFESNGERFGTILQLDNGLDAFSIAEKVDSWLQSISLNKKRIFMFTSDGASVMLGRRAGVAQLLRSQFGYKFILDYHCICHRENLALKDAFKENSIFAKLEKVLRDAINYMTLYHNVDQLKRISHELDSVFCMPHRIIDIRWLSRFRVVNEFVKSLPVIAKFFDEKEVAGDTIASDIRSRLFSPKMVLLLHFLHDLLRPFEPLMLQLQSSALHPFDANKLACSTIQLVEDQFLTDESVICGQSFEKFCNLIHSGAVKLTDSLTASIRSSCEKKIKKLAKSMTENLKNRLWNDDEVISAFQLINPISMNQDLNQNFSEFGNDQLKVLYEFYVEAINLNWEDLLSEWNIFKYNYLNPSNGSISSTWKDLISIACKNSAIFPNFSQLCHILNCFNAQNATVERGFSLMNRICTKNRNKIQPAVLDILMRLRLSSENFDTFNYGPAVQDYFMKTIYSLGRNIKRKQSFKNVPENPVDDEEANFSCFNDMIEF